MLSPLTGLAILVGVATALIWSAICPRNRRKLFGRKPGPRFPEHFYKKMVYDP